MKSKAIFTDAIAARQPSVIALLWVSSVTGMLLLAGCTSASPLHSKVDQAFLKKAASDPFPSAAESGLLGTPARD